MLVSVVNIHRDLLVFVLAIFEDGCPQVLYLRGTYYSMFTTSENGFYSTGVDKWSLVWAPCITLIHVIYKI